MAGTCRRRHKDLGCPDPVLSTPSAYRQDVEAAPELVLFVERLYRSWVALDYESIIEAMSRNPGTLMIGSDPSEWWSGPKDIAAVLRAQVQEMPSFSLDIEEVSAWNEGNVGWAAVRAQFVLDDRPPALTRTTLVLRQEGAYWRIVHWHFSIAITNEELLGVDLTTTVDEILITIQDEDPPMTAVASDGSVTIAFTDIEGSTALMETLGEDPWLKLLEWHESAVRQQTKLFGGSVVKGQGDGFMLAFPASGSAVACASALQGALGSGWAGVPVPVRIGMHTGNARSEAGDFFGRTVVVAARVAGAARGGEILVTQAVQEDLEGAFRLGTSRTLALKGLAGRHPVFPVEWR